MVNLEEGQVAGGVRPLRGRLAAWLILIILIAGAVLVALDWEKFASVLAQADWRPVLIALGLTAVSYLCVSSAFAVTSRLLGIQIRYRDLTEIGFISIILNHVLTAGGVAGYSVRYILMRQRGAASRDILAATILHFYLTSLDMLTMLPVGFLYLFLNAALPVVVTSLVGLMTLVMAGVAVIATGLIFREGWRSRVTGWLTRLGDKLLHRNFSETLQRFDATLGRGVEAMRRQPFSLLLILALTWIDWFSSVGVVWLCFDAFGTPMSVGSILTAYVIGVMAGVLSMVPGGLGVQEGSMVGIFVLLGASPVQALLASILFRGIFFFLPYGFSLLFYGRLLRPNTTKLQTETTENQQAEGE